MLVYLLYECMKSEVETKIKSLLVVLSKVSKTIIILNCQENPVQIEKVL